MAYIGQTPTAVALDGDDLSDDIITLAKMASGTDGNIITYDASGNPAAVATGTDGQVLTSTGAGSAPAFEALPASGVTLGTPVASTSGTAITFSSIPAGTKRIIISYVGVSTSGSSAYNIRLGDSGGLEATGYLGIGYREDSTKTFFTTGFGIGNDTGGPDIIHGLTILTLVDASTFSWASTTHTGHSNSAQITQAAGSKSLSAELTQVSVTTAGGSDTFDAGKINIQYE